MKHYSGMILCSEHNYRYYPNKGCPECAEKSKIFEDYLDTKKTAEELIRQAREKGLDK